MRKFKKTNKLTNKQQNRITKKKSTLSLLNVNETQNPSNTNQVGLVVTHYGDTVDIENNLKQHIRCNLRQNLPPLAVGDIVVFQLADNTLSNGIVIQLSKRTSLLARNNTAKAVTKPIAANLDQIFVIFAPEPEPQSLLIDQFLITAEMCHIPATLVFNKYDLYESNTQNELYINKINGLIEAYKQIGYPVISTSIYDRSTIESLEKLLAKKSSIFVGPSGVGKSTLTQQFVPDAIIKIGNISERTQQGKHTTSVAKLYHLPNNGNLIDSPGIREIGIAHLSRKELEDCYPEFQTFKHQCKFRDCLHLKEPNCAFKQAVLDGHINKFRWDNYLKFAENLN